MDEHAEAGFAPPGHARVALRWRFGVLDGGDRVVDGGLVGLGTLKLGVGESGGGDQESGGDAAVQEIHAESLG